jgi:hypothetical protein
MAVCTSARSWLLALWLFVLAFPGSAQTIKIKIVSLTWTVPPQGLTAYRAKAILPSGVHVLLTCQGVEKRCALTIFAPDKAGCDREHMAITCGVTDLGYFPARRDGDDLLISIRREDRKYRISGSW